MPPVGFEPMISAGERPQSYALDRAATGTGRLNFTWRNCKQQILWKLILHNVGEYHYFFVPDDKIHTYITVSYQNNENE